MARSVFFVPLCGMVAHLVMLYLEACAGSCLRTWDLPINDEGLIVGRNAKCGIRDLYISRRHCQVLPFGHKQLVLRTIRSCFVWIDEEWNEIVGTYYLSIGDRLSLDEEIQVCYVVACEKLEDDTDDQEEQESESPSAGAAPPAAETPPPPELWWLSYRRCMPAIASADSCGWWSQVRSHLCSPLCSLLRSVTCRRRALFWSAQVHAADRAAGEAEAEAAAVSWPVTLVRNQNSCNWQCSESVTSNMRHILLDWMLEVVEKYCNDNDDVFYRSSSLVDRFMAQDGSEISRGCLQLVGVAALLLASKYEVTHPLKISTLVHLSADTYSHAEIRSMEMRMLQALDYRLAGATAASCFSVLSQAKRGGEEGGARSRSSAAELAISSLDRYLLDQSVLDPALIGMAPLAMAQHILERTQTARLLGRLRNYGKVVPMERRRGLARKHHQHLEFAPDGVTPACLVKTRGGCSESAARL